jgi:Rrf2 family protein
VLAARPGEAAELKQIARRFALPEAALAKSFQTLARAGLISSRRGPNGGYILEREPRSLTLADVVTALGGADRRGGLCLLEERPCSPGGACALHASAAAADAKMLRALRALTLADLRVQFRGGRP